MKVLLVAALLAAVAADSTPAPAYKPRVYTPAPAYKQPSYDQPAQYKYDYAVKGYSEYEPEFGAQESRDGYNTQGSYYVVLPDGRTQKVTYTVNGDEGYVADVTYEGEARYDAYSPKPAYKPAPAYKPQPSYTPAPAYKPTPAYN